MVGAKQIEFGWEDFATGMASSDYAGDGNLAVSSDRLNPFVTLGVMRSMASSANKSTSLVGDPIATCEDSQAGLGSNNRLMVDNAANYYTVSSDGTLTKQQTGSATSHYTTGKTDMISFAQNTYTSLDNDISIWNTAANTFTESWWVGTKSQSSLNAFLPHPMIVFESLMWIADGNVLHTMTAAGTVSTNVLVLNSTERIYALGIDPNTGLMLISIQNSTNYSDSLSSKFFVLLFDGYSSKVRRKVPVEDLVTAFYVVGGTVYIGYGSRIGVWTGAGITFLRKLSTSTFGSDLPYKHHFSSLGHILLVINGLKVMGYGEVIPGKKAWFNLAGQDSGNSNLGVVAGISGTTFCVGSPTGNWFAYDISSSSAGVGSLIFNNNYLGRPIFIRRVRVFTTGITTSSGIGSVAILDEKGNVNQKSGTAGQFLVPSTASPQYVFDFDYSALKVHLATPRIIFDTQGFGIAKVVIFYDPAE